VGFGLLQNALVHFRPQRTNQILGADCEEGYPSSQYFNPVRDLNRGQNSNEGPKGSKNIPQGLKPNDYFVAFEARLKSCPVTKHTRLFILRTTLATEGTAMEGTETRKHEVFSANKGTAFTANILFIFAQQERTRLIKDAAVRLKCRAREARCGWLWE
jgi:hypothetical protein